MKRNISWISKIFIPTLISLFIFSGIASAHVSVMPRTSTTGAWETYTLKVPVEKDVATTKVTVKVPAGLEIESYQPVPGWNYSTEKDASGKAKTITFVATGEGILPGQIQQFIFVAKNPDKATKVAWDVYQYYKDGSVVEWTGDEGADSPHAITDIVTGTTTYAPVTQQNKKAQTKTTESSSSSLPLILSIVSILLSIMALVLAIRKK